MKKIITDTNVWYKIENGDLDPTPIKNRLFINPYSIIELSAGIDGDSFEKRKKVAITDSRKIG